MMRSNTMYALLREQAGETVYPTTYGLLASVLRVIGGTGCHRRHIAGMLARVEQRCTAQGEPDLTAFVVGKNGQPGTGWAGWTKGDDPEQVRKTAHEYFRKEIWGK